MGKRFLIIGSGFSGAVVARELAENLDCKIDVWDARDHVAGNCHTERDAETGVLVHRYGPHIFNTDNKEVWSYVNRFGAFRPFVNRVKAVTSRGVFSMPINLLTINQFFGKSMNPQEARDFVAGLGDASIGEPANFEEQALKMLGRDLYEAFFKGYTVKQWGCDPRELPASVLKRLPVRFNYDDNYYAKRFQGIPEDGYTAVIAGILGHPRIVVNLNRRFDPGQASELARRYDHVFYTGPLDEFFAFSEGRLGYRTVTFERIKTDVHDYQGNAVINYPDMSVPWTRIHEHKHFTPWESHERTVAFREFSKETDADDVPYYPKRLAADKALLLSYREMAASSLPCPVSFLGRLATYRYMDMEAVIAEALTFALQIRKDMEKGCKLPIFSNREE